MTPRVYLLVPGINTRTDDNGNWAPIMATEVNLRTPYKGDEYRYFAGPFLRRLNQQDHADQIYGLAMRYVVRGFDVVGVAHSNGNDMLNRAVLKMLATGSGSFHSLHLVAAASEASFRINGYNRALSCGVIRERVTCYCSKSDWAIGKVARFSRLLGGAVGLGYGTLGVDGPLEVTIPEKVFTEWAETGHSGWFNEPDLQGRLFTNLIQP